MRIVSRNKRNASLLFILISSGLIQWILRPEKFAGPDTPKFLEIASKQLESGFWLDPSAFDGNYWSIGYPTFLALLKRTVGISTETLQLTHIFLGLVLVLLTWLISARLGPLIQVVATCLVAFNPNFWGLSALGGYEVLLGVLIVGGTFLTQLYSNLVGEDAQCGQYRVKILLVLLSGILLGLAVMVQSKSFIIFIVFAFWWARTSIRSLAVGTVGLLIVLLPWSIRNHFVLGTGSPFNSNGPINMWIGNNPGQSTGGFMEPPPLPTGSSDFVQGAFIFTVSQPELAFQLLIRKIGRLMEPLFFYIGNGEPSRLQWAVHVTAILLTILVVAGFALYLVGRVWLSSPPLPPVGFLAATVVAFFTVNLPFIAEARFMSPVIPLTTVIAVSTLSALIEVRMRQRIKIQGVLISRPEKS